MDDSQHVSFYKLNKDELDPKNNKKKFELETRKNVGQVKFSNFLQTLQSKPQPTVLNKNCLVISQRAYSTQSELNYRLSGDHDYTDCDGLLSVLEQEDQNTFKVSAVSAIKNTSLIAQHVTDPNHITIMQNPGERMITTVGGALLDSVLSVTFLAG